MRYREHTSPRYGISIYLCKEERIDVRIINHSNMVLHYGESLESPTGSPTHTLLVHHTQY